MTANQELIEFIENLSTEPVEKQARVIAALFEAIDMMNQGKNNEEILKHFGIA